MILIEVGSQVFEVGDAWKRGKVHVTGDQFRALGQCGCVDDRIGHGNVMRETDISSGQRDGIGKGDEPCFAHLCRSGKGFLLASLTLDDFVHFVENNGWRDDLIQPPEMVRVGAGERPFGKELKPPRRVDQRHSRSRFSRIAPAFMPFKNPLKDVSG